MNCSLIRRSYLLASIAYLVLLFNTLAVDAAFVGHSHHNKRQQPSLNPTPMLTFDVEPHGGIHPSQPPTSNITDYYYSVDSALFNFTCTIKHPSYAHKLIITRERILNNGEKLAPEDLIDASSYNLNPAIKDNRISIEFFDPGQLKYLDPNVNHLRASLLIKNLKLEDNAIYTCKYNTITKQINTIVYKQPVMKDLYFPTPKFHLKTPVSITCKIEEVYPKPKFSFTVPNREDLNKFIEEKDVTKEIQPGHISLFAIQSTLQFTPEYTDNNQLFNCSVTLQTNTNTVISKTIKIQVEGNQIIEDKCNDYYVVKVGDIDHKIECVYFSNPRLDAFFEVEEEDVSDDAETTDEGAESPTENASDAIKKEKTTKTVEIRDGDEDKPNYSLVIEKYGDPTVNLKTGLYKAVLTIKDVTEKNLKTYKFKLENLERDIRLGTDTKKELSIKGVDSTASILHSKVSTALMCTLVLFRLF